MSWIKVITGCALGLVSSAWTISAGAAFAYPAAPGIKAAAAVVIDADSAQVLFERNAHARRAPASTTKIMTSLLAVESGRLDEYVTISKRAASIGESTIYLKEGERLTLRQLTYGVLLSSGNDASTAVAEFLGGGSEARFIEMMNARADAIGMRDTHFSNPHGLPTDNHYSSAYDLAMLLREAAMQPEWNQIAETKWKRIPGFGKVDGRTLKNHNKLLWNYPYATGGKTGFTNAAGRCFVGSAKRGSRRVIQASLASSDLWRDTQSLLQYGLDNFENVAVAKEGEIVGTVPIQAGSSRMVEVIAPRDVTVSLPKGHFDRTALQQVWQLPDELVAPVNQRQPVGQLIVRQGERVLQTVPLVAASAVPIAASPWELLSSWFFPGMVTASLLSLMRLKGLRRRRLNASLDKLPKAAGNKRNPLARESFPRAS
ncbi:MAG: D-alanyl-D-alanine carboxypeptidase family protein [Candidatus Sericytochromatia bacterium]|nr:D-alanyl-D-alanine carboxypeptidase family protein [Candidatus Sericytochromatia bacterium]